MEVNYQKNKHKLLFFPFIGITFIAAAGFVVYYLWNAIIPELIPAVNHISYLHAIGLFILSRILFGGFKGAQGRFGKNKMNLGKRMKEKMMNMSDEEREKFKSEWKQRCSR